MNSFVMNNMCLHNVNIYCGEKNLIFPDALKEKKIAPPNHWMAVQSNLASREQKLGLLFRLLFNVLMK